MPLVPDGVIALPDTGGRIDHLAIDLGRKRLFVAELGNGTVDVIDLATSKVIFRISGLDEPQGVTYAQRSDRLVVACGDGSVKVYDGRVYAPRGIVKLDDDADNVRLDATTGNVIVGHGKGGLAVVDSANASLVADIPLPAHPEAFEIAGTRIFVNVPDANQIDVVDLGQRGMIGTWSTSRLSSNFPMAVSDTGQLAAVFRGQDRLVLLDTASGNVVVGIDTCGDADDVFYDRKRRRYYVSCGSGAIDVIDGRGGSLHALARVPTSWGARTSLYVPELDLLFVAERAGLLGSDAKIAIFRPAPTTP